MNENLNLEQKIEAVLFYKNEPQSFKNLAKVLKEDENKIKEAVLNLAASLENRGICLIQTESEVSLATAPQTKELIEQMAKEEIRSEIGKAGLETLAIILYNGPISRREIDLIRGVNSTFIIRNLAIRGLVERSEDSIGERTPKYKGTISLLAHLGITKVEDLPEFNLFKEKAKEVQSDGEQI